VENQICSRFIEGNFRSPSHAVPAHSSIIFEIEIPRTFGLRGVSLVWIHDENNQYDFIKMKWMGIKSGRDIFETEVKVDDKGLNWYYFQLKTVTGVFYVGKSNENYVIQDKEPSSWLLTVYDDAFETPDWIKGGLFYHIFVDRFSKDGPANIKDDVILRSDWGGVPSFQPNENGEVVNNDFFGGNLKGIRSKLDFIQSLGVSCLYLSPIFEAYSNHKYDTGDFTKIDQMFGTSDDFQELCEEADKRGIRILLDGVFNHTGSDSIYFNKKGRYENVGAYQSKESEYYPWYQFIDFPEEYESWWGIHTLPSVNKENPSYLEFITGKKGIAARWLKAGASGWRLDVVDELPDHFIEQIRTAVKSQNEDALIVGEVWEDASYKISYGKRKHYLLGNQLDSVMNYPFMNAIIQFVRYGDAENLHYVINEILHNYPPPVVHSLMNILGTHDTPRILTALGGKELVRASKEEMSRTKMTSEERNKAINLLQMASLIQVTLPGVPCIYYGDEAGLEGYGDPFNRRCYPWGREEVSLIDWYQKLGTIRKNWSVFKKGDYKTIYASQHIFIFQRKNEKEQVVIGVNRSQDPFSMDIEGEYTDLLNSIKVNTNYILDLNSYCFLGRRLL
jgi:cyclomaltodextrinase / maltogenic alpha-amylase / neopullulanase